MNCIAAASKSPVRVRCADRKAEYALFMGASGVCIAASFNNVARLGRVNQSVKCKYFVTVLPPLQSGV